MRQRRWTHLACVALLFVASRSSAAGPYTGIDLGVSEPTTDNYRSHIETGVTAAPFVGFLFSDYIAVQSQFHLFFQPPDDNDDRPQPSLDNPHQWTSIAGLTVGPRFSLPIVDRLRLHLLAQGGGFKGLGGRLNQWAPGFNVGGGVDYEVTGRFAIGLFARWNRLYMAPHPTRLDGHVENDQGPEDVQFATMGLSLSYAYGHEPEVVRAPVPPAAVALTPAPAASAPATQKKIVLRSVHFDFDNADLRPDAAPVLDAAVETLKQEGGQHVVVEGHTDGRGSEAYNLELSRRRAETVRRYFVAQGIESGRIRSVAMGEAQPVTTNDTEEGRAQNRRVELRLDQD